MSESPSVEPIFVSVKDVARILACSPWVVYQLLDNIPDGADRPVIDSQYQGRRRLVRLSSVKEYADGLPRTAPRTEASA